MKQNKTRLIVLIGTLFLIIAGGVVVIISSMKNSNFYNWIESKKFIDNAGKSHEIVMKNNYSFITTIVFTGILLLFALFSLFYALDKKGTTKIIRKWPYIVLTVFFVGGLILKLYGITKLGQDIKIENTPKEIQDEINAYYKVNYLDSLKLFTYINIGITSLKLAFSITLLTLTKKIKEQGDINYSKKIKASHIDNNQNIDLP